LDPEGCVAEIFSKDEEGYLAGEWLGSPTKCGRLRGEDKGGGWYDQSKHVDVWM
jgi:hypothetical protein